MNYKNSFKQVLVKIRNRVVDTISVLYFLSAWNFIKICIFKHKQEKKFPQINDQSFALQ